MAKIPKKPHKGAPPPMAETAANLDKPDPAELQPLNLKVPLEFKRELKVYAAQQGRTMTDILLEGYKLLRLQRG